MYQYNSVMPSLLGDFVSSRPTGAWCNIERRWVKFTT